MSFDPSETPKELPTSVEYASVRRWGDVGEAHASGGSESMNTFSYYSYTKPGEIIHDHNKSFLTLK